MHCHLQYRLVMSIFHRHTFASCLHREDNLSVRVGMDVGLKAAMEGDVGKLEKLLEGGWDVATADR